MKEPRSKNLLKKKLLKLLEVLETRKMRAKDDSDFSSIAVGVIDFLSAVALELTDTDNKDISHFGMALLSLRLGRPDQTAFWLEIDKALAERENCEIGKDEMDFLVRKYEEQRRIWINAPNLEAER